MPSGQTNTESLQLKNNQKVVLIMQKMQQQANMISKIQMMKILACNINVKTKT